MKLFESEPQIPDGCENSNREIIEHKLFYLSKLLTAY